MWAALLAVRKPAVALMVPGAFMVMMAIGAAAGFAGIKLPLVEAAILASVFVIGGLIIGAVRLPVAWAMAIVGLFAVFHGYAHALEAPGAGAGGYIWGSLWQRHCCRVSALRSAGVCSARSRGGRARLGRRDAGGRRRRPHCPLEVIPTHTRSLARLSLLSAAAGVFRRQ